MCCSFIIGISDTDTNIFFMTLIFRRNWSPWFLCKMRFMISQNMCSWSCDSPSHRVLFGLFSVQLLCISLLCCDKSTWHTTVFSAVVLPCWYFRDTVVGNVVNLSRKKCWCKELLVLFFLLLFASKKLALPMTRRFLVLKCMEDLQYKYLVIWVNNFALIFAISNKWVEPHGKAAKMEMSPCRRVFMKPGSAADRAIGEVSLSFTAGVLKLYVTFQTLGVVGRRGNLGPKLPMNLRNIANFLFSHFIYAAKDVSMILYL